MQHASHVNTEEYARFFTIIATQLKEKYPNLRLSLAGVACFDSDYLQRVLSEIQRIRSKKDLEMNLVDSINFHPYREDPEKGSAEIENGNFIQGDRMSYVNQLSEMLRIGEEFHVEIIVGEINFSSFDPSKKLKLERALALTKDKAKSLIYSEIEQTK